MAKNDFKYKDPFPSPSTSTVPRDYKIKPKIKEDKVEKWQTEVERIEGQLVQLELSLGESFQVTDARRKELEKLISKNEKEFIKNLKLAEERLTTNNFKSIELIGLFVALFTFFSVSFQFLEKVQDLNTAIILMFLLLSCILLLIVSIDMMVQCMISKETKKTLLTLQIKNIPPDLDNPINKFHWIFLSVAIILLTFSIISFNRNLNIKNPSILEENPWGIHILQKDGDNYYLHYRGVAISKEELKILGVKFLERCKEECKGKILYIFDNKEVLKAVLEYQREVIKPPLDRKMVKKHYILRLDKDNDEVTTYPPISESKE